MGPEDKAKPGEPGTVAAGVKKLKDNQVDSVYSQLTEQARGRRADGTVEGERPRDGRSGEVLEGTEEVDGK